MAPGRRGAHGAAGVGRGIARYRAVVEYDGTDYLGFQRQEPGRGATVQGELEAALERFSGQTVAVVGAGRTDSGVHALGQVVAFDLEWGHGPADLSRALNANLPRTIAVREVAECSPDFHPRYSATGRRYRYTIYSAAERSPLRDRFGWHVWPAPDAAAMQAASQSLIGTHDFAAFGRAPEEGGHTVRTVREARWESSQATAGAMFVFEIEADAFLYRMVRSIVGTLKQVGGGDLTVAEFREILASADRSRPRTLAPASGLCLIEVLY